MVTVESRGIRKLTLFIAAGIDGLRDLRLPREAAAPDAAAEVVEEEAAGLRLDIATLLGRELSIPIRL